MKIIRMKLFRYTLFVTLIKLLFLTTGCCPICSCDSSVYLICESTGEVELKIDNESIEKVDLGNIDLLAMSGDTLIVGFLNSNIEVRIEVLFENETWSLSHAKVYSFDESDFWQLENSTFFMETGNFTTGDCSKFYHDIKGTFIKRKYTTLPEILEGRINFETKNSINETKKLELIIDYQVVSELEEWGEC